MPPADAFIGLGSNVGDRAVHLRTAATALGQLATTHLIARSRVYQTPPVGPVDQSPYFNAALHLQTELDPPALLAAMRCIETDAGRPSAEKRRRWGPRELDLDLLLYGDAVIDMPGLRVPHPRLAERWFVLRPLADIAAEWVHPVLGRTIGQLLADLEALGDSPAAGRGHVLRGVAF